MSSLPPPTTAPAGWYPDPEGAGVRFFDGRGWAPPVARFAERGPHPSLPMRAAVGALVILLASLLTGRALLEIVVEFDWPVMTYVALLGVIGYGPSLAWAWYVRQRWGGNRMVTLGWQFRWSDLGWGPLTWLSALGTQMAVGALILVLDVPFSSNVDDVGELDVDRSYIVATLITAVIAAPLVEEIVFRGIVMRGFLSRFAPVLAIALQGMLFGVAHVDPVRGAGNIGLAIVLSAVGCAFGAAAFFTRRIGPSVIAHAILNGVVMVIVLTGVFDDIQTDFGAVALLLGR